MKFRFELENILTGEKKNCKTLSEISKTLNIPYHQVRSILLSEDKLFLHNHITEYCSKYKIRKL